MSDTQKHCTLYKNLQNRTVVTHKSKMNILPVPLRLTIETYFEMYNIVPKNFILLVVLIKLVKEVCVIIVF